MGLVDLKNHVVKKVFKMPEGKEGKISCAVAIGAFAFFLAAFFSGMLSTKSVEANLMITSLHWDALLHNQSQFDVGFPQVVYCPMGPWSSIVDIKCWKSNKGWYDTIAGMQLLPTDLKPGTEAENPNWTCKGFNLDGKQVTDPTMTVFCQLNTTDKGRYQNETARVAPVRVFLDLPGTGEFVKCENCVDGIDGTFMLVNTTTLAFFEADIVTIPGIVDDDDDDTIVDYKTTSTSLPTQPQFGETTNMDIVVGFYTMDVWEFTQVGEYAAAFAGESWGRFVTLVGGAAIFSYGLYVLISTILVLLIIGDDASSGTSTEKRALLG